MAGFSDHIKDKWEGKSILLQRYAGSVDPEEESSPISQSSAQKQCPMSEDRTSGTGVRR